MSTVQGGPPDKSQPEPPSEETFFHNTHNDASVANTSSENQKKIEVYRARMGLLAVAVSDVAIAVAAILGVILIHKDNASSTAVVSILSTAFTAVGTLTTAYLGIKASANTAQNSMSNQAQNASPGPTQNTSPSQ
jgi:hypothetical protein